MIQISDNYAIETDGDKNYIIMVLSHKKERVNGKWVDTDETYWSEKYYPGSTFDKALKLICEKELLSTEFKDLKTIEKKYKELMKKIDELKGKIDELKKKELI